MPMVHTDPPRLMRPSVDDPAAAEAANAFQEARGVAPFGPFVPLLHHPALLARVEALGRGVRYQGDLPDDVREVAVLATAAAWQQSTEWSIHAPVAVAAGVAQSTLDALQRGGMPDDAPWPQVCAIRFVQQVHALRDVEDPVFDAAMKAFGPAGLIELSVLAGYYALLAVVLNVTRLHEH